MNTWPHPGDNYTTIARKVALAYREELIKAAPERVDELDLQMRQFGQYWVTNLAAALDDDEWVDADTAGSILGIQGANVSAQRAKGNLRGVRHGRRFLYLVKDVREFGARRQAVQRAKLALRTSADTVSASGTSVE